MRASWIRRIVAPALSLLVLSAPALSACATGGGTEPTARPEADASAGGTSAHSSGRPSAPTTSGASELADGRHAVYLTGLDVTNRTMTFDLIQFLTGEEARKAWVKEHPERPEGPDNGYLIINDNPKLRTLPVAGAVTILVIDQTSTNLDTMQFAFADLPAYFAPRKPPEGNALYALPFWLTVTGGQIVRMEEQFVP
jgi:hypothetical protein